MPISRHDDRLAAGHRLHRQLRGRRCLHAARRRAGAVSSSATPETTTWSARPAATPSSASAATIRSAGLGGNDTLDGGTGNDSIDGGSGDDTAVFSGNLVSYALADLGVRHHDLGAGRERHAGRRRASALCRRHDPSQRRQHAVRHGLLRPHLSRRVPRRRRCAQRTTTASAAREGRDPNAFFSTSWYLSLNPDVRASGVNPLDHYHSTGWREGRDPAPNFDTALYLKNNPDVAASGVDPLEHYLQFGRAEGRAVYQAVGSTVARLRRRSTICCSNPDVSNCRRRPAAALQHFRLARRAQSERPVRHRRLSVALHRRASVRHQPVAALRAVSAGSKGAILPAGFDTLQLHRGLSGCRGRARQPARSLPQQRHLRRPLALRRRHLALIGHSSVRMLMRAIGRRSMADEPVLENQVARRTE